MLYNRFFLLLSFIFSSVSCVSVKEGRQLRESLFSVQKRLLVLESGVAETGQHSKDFTLKSLLTVNPHGKFFLRGDSPVVLATVGEGKSRKALF